MTDLERATALIEAAEDELASIRASCSINFKPFDNLFDFIRKLSERSTAYEASVN